MAGQAAPSVRGSSSIRERAESTAWFFAGFGLGGLLLSAILAIIKIPGRYLLSDGDSSTVLTVVIMGLLVGDMVAVTRGRYYPLTLRRQTPQRLMYTHLDRRVVFFVWAADVGTGVTTFRVTSGVWVLCALDAFGGLSPWYALAYSAGFVVAMASFMALPTAGGDLDERASNLAVRAAKMGALRRHAQVLYIAVALVCLALASSRTAWLRLP